MLAVDAFSALLQPYTIDNHDYVSEEPFKGFREVRSSLILTNSYVDTDVLDIRQFRKMGLLFDITKGSLTSFEYQVWISHDNVNWFVEATETIAAGTITDTAANYTISLSGNVKYFKILNVYAPYVKLAVKGTGTVTGSLLDVTILGVM
jgi:hypothetical protein